MNVDNALELQVNIFKDMFGYVEVAGVALDDGISGPVSSLMDPRALEVAEVMSTRAGMAEFEGSGSSTRHTGRMTELIALGTTAPDEKSQVKLTVLVQDNRYLKGRIVEGIKEKVGSEVEVISIGRQKANWTRSRTAPVRLGSSIAPAGKSYSGTLGCYCVDLASGAQALLSNNHVIAETNRLNPGAPIQQPSRPDGGTPANDVIARLTRFVPINATGGPVNFVDAAIAQLTNARPIDQARIYNTTGTYPANPVVTTVRPNAIVTPAINMPVVKIGRTTGLTRGSILAINVNNLYVQYGPGIGLRRFDRQITVGATVAGQPFLRGGDSGSLMVTPNGEPVGLLFATSTTGGPFGLGVANANRIDLVLSQLNIRLI